MIQIFLYKENSFVAFKFLEYLIILLVYYFKRIYSFVVLFSKLPLSSLQGWLAVECLQWTMQIWSATDKNGHEEGSNH